MSRSFYTIFTILVICSFLTCVPGCTVKPVPLNKDDVPLGITEEIEEFYRLNPRGWRLKELTYYVFEPEGDGYIVIALASITIPRLPAEPDREEFVSGFFKETTDWEGNQVWTANWGRGALQLSPYGHEKSEASFSKDKLSIVLGDYRSSTRTGWGSAGWVRDPNVTKIELININSGKTVTAKIKNGFWWADLYDLDIQSSSDVKIVAYSDSGKVLYEGYYN